MKEIRVRVPLAPEIERVATVVIDCAFLVHRALGPGLLESVYEECMMHELSKCAFKVNRQVTVPIIYGGKTLQSALRLDLLVEDCIVVELKAVERLLPLHHAQMLTYLKLCQKRLGLLINFNVATLRSGIKRVIR